MVSIEGIASLEGVGGFALISRSGQHREMEERPHIFGKMCFSGSAIRNNCSKGWAGTGTATQGVGRSPSLNVSKNHREGVLTSGHGGVGWGSWGSFPASVTLRDASLPLAGRSTPVWGSCRAWREQSDARKGRGKQLHFSLPLENSYHALSAELTMAGRPAAGWNGPSSKEMPSWEGRCGLDARGNPSPRQQ